MLLDGIITEILDAISVFHHLGITCQCLNCLYSQ